MFVLKITLISYLNVFIIHAPQGHRGVALAILASYLSASHRLRHQSQQQQAAVTSSKAPEPSPSRGGVDASATSIPPDPRTVTDAYSNTPFAIAASRKHDDALMTLLDPRWMGVTGSFLL